MYQRLRKASLWEDEPLIESSGRPHSHDILASMDLLDGKKDGSGELATFGVGLECKSAPLAEVVSRYRAGRLGTSDDRSGHANCCLSPTVPWLRTTPILSIKSMLSEGSKSLVGSLSPRASSSYRSRRQQLHPQQRLQRPLAFSPRNEPRTNSQEPLLVDLDHTRTACDTLPNQSSATATRQSPDVI